jgi:septal ring factor EnvC (AmiA/AmiB activator)
MEQSDKTAAEAMGAEPERPGAAVKPTSRLGRFLRRALRWATATLVVFGLGVAATWFNQVRPRIAQQEALEQGLAAVEAQRDQLQAAVDELQGVQAENEVFQAELQETEGRLALLRVLIDVTSAQLGIAQEDPIAAKAALENTAAALVDLGKKLGPSEASTVAALQERLALALEEMEPDIFAAQRDLEILANSLLEIERDQFGS